MKNKYPSFGGLILAAGRSERMGEPKLNLPWGKTTVLGQVIKTLVEAGINHIFVVINPNRRPIIPKDLPNVEITWIENPVAETNEMLKSIQTGLSEIPDVIQNILICLGDQPTIRSEAVKSVLEAANDPGKTLIFPSYRFRRGHPWVVNRKYWSEICELSETDTVRTFVQANADSIQYVNIDENAPEDMDTPEMYQRLKQSAGM
jgi:molybdenum cofactor cytidylyltransferase